MTLVIPAVQTELVPLVLELWSEDGSRLGGLYPRARIFERDGVTLVDTVVLAEGGLGQYHGFWGVPGQDKWIVRYEVFEDLGHTIAVEGLVFGEPDLIVSDQIGQQPILRASAIQPGLC